MIIEMIEKLIKYQNDSEKNFEEKKNISTIVNYIFALIIFFSSTIVSAFTFPFRFLYRKIFLKKNKSKIIHLNGKNIDSVLKEEKLVLIDFWAEWCGPCLMMNTTIEKFANESKNIQIAKVNADLNRKLLDRFQIRGLPQFILLKNGKEIKRYAGAMTVFDLNKFCSETD
ncbi:thioredoxin [Aquimarina sp. AD1]|nr:thioredoxin [Aquimarina sp. AD1]RKN08909.1 thioredoxin [Aquimarina sp. AD1]